MPPDRVQDEAGDCGRRQELFAPTIFVRFPFLESWPFQTRLRQHRPVASFATEHMTNNRWLKLLTILTIVCASGAAMAQNKVGFANINRILQQSETGKTARAKLDREFAPRLDALNKLNDSILAARADLQKNAPTLSPTAIQQRERELVSMSTDLQRKKREYDEDYDVRQREATAEFSNKVSVIVRKVAVAERYDMMFQEAVWWSPSIDITDKIIRELDAADGGAAKSR